jgi:hypothetical protein
MRSVLRLLGTRYGIALVLAVLVLAVVGAGKVFTSNGRASVPIGPVVAPPSTPAPLGPSLGDDSAVDPSASDASPSLSPGAADPATVAARFMTAWLKHTNVTPQQWRAGLAPNATTALMTKLTDTDPATVPASSTQGQIQTLDRGSVVEASVPVNGGTVRLRLVSVRGRWQVDGVDWEPS